MKKVTVEAVTVEAVKTVEPIQSEVIIEAKKSTIWAEKMAKITLRQEQEAFGLAYLKALEVDEKKRPGVIVSILDIITKSETGVNESQILEQLSEMFPNRKESSMTNTIKAQIGGKKRPLRMEREKQIIFEIVENKAGVKTYKLEVEEAI